MNDILMNLKIVAKILNSLKRKVDKLVFDMLKTVATGLTKFPAGKYWSPGHPEDVPKDPIWPSGDMPIWRPGEVLTSCPGDVLKWRPEDVLIWHSRDVPGKLIWDVPRTFSGRPLGDLQSAQTCMSQHFFSSRTYSIDQIYLKTFQHSRCIENPVKLLRWRISRKIS